MNTVIAFRYSIKCYKMVAKPLENVKQIMYKVPGNGQKFNFQSFGHCDSMETFQKKGGSFVREPLFNTRRSLPVNWP
jgi:hypothetical protein